MKRVNVSSYFFVILGALEGALLALISAFFIDYMITKYSLVYSLTFIDWVAVLVPFYAVIGALFNLLSAIFLYDENTVKPAKRYKKKEDKKEVKKTSKKK